ncbi:MAG TPA: TonB family protein [Steroidobacteraceae bacterium]|nr:TonB family protein [Steroidobacteraceae bacterium]
MASLSLKHTTDEAPIAVDLPRGLGLRVESLVVLSREAALAQAVKGLGSEHDVLTIDAEERLDEALLGRHTGVAVLDAAAATGPIEVLTERLRAQFPELVLIVAGGHEHQSALARQITNGTVYRFLHKPVSEPRVKLFVEAAWRRHSAEQAEASDVRAATGTYPRPGQPPSRIGLVALGIALSVLVALGVWYATRKPDAPQAVAAPETARATNDPQAQVASQIDRLLSAAETQLGAQHLEEAQNLIAQARALKPDHVRVAFLAARLAKERERAQLAQARLAALAAQAHRLEQQKLAEQVTDDLAKAADRLRAGQIIEPAEDNARFFIDSARDLAPGDADVRQAQSQLADRLVAEARTALSAGKAADAQHWIDAAANSGVATDTVASLTQDLQHLQHPQPTVRAEAAPEPPASAVNVDTRVAAAGARVTEQKSAPTQAVAPPASEPVIAATLHRTHYSAPTFPVSARERGVSGWVDIQFVVKTDGTVSDVVATGAEPVGMFEQAATDAVRKWRYQPLIRDGQPVEQRARVRMTFALKD